ncbi:hypothetical protein IJF85_01040 [Candidatus Saccharibacteria bacterium]|nr:hypothetical protein [Candidatus Saccharibacteria bacterium]
MDNVIGFEALYESAMKCKKGVLWKDSVAHYILNIIEETVKLEEQLKSGTYHPRPQKPFTVSSCGKMRTVMGVAFRDRVYQRSLNDNAIYPAMVKSFIYDNGACQKNKGTNFSRERLVCFLQRYYRKHGTKGYVLQCDIKGYYPNMRHDVVEKTFRKQLPPEIHKMACEVMRGQYSGEVGYLPGSQMIQIAGISVLNGLDHFIKERLRIKLYTRYMDDFILIHENKEYLEKCREEIVKQLEPMGFELHPKKTRIYSIKEGIKYLGFIYRLTDTGKVVRTVLPKNVKSYRRKLFRLVKLAKKGKISHEKVDECYRSWRAHAEKGDSTKLLRRMDAYYRDLWK